MFRSIDRCCSGAHELVVIAFQSIVHVLLPAPDAPRAIPCWSVLACVDRGLSGGGQAVISTDK